MPTIIPFIVTPDLSRLQGFYAGLFDAEEIKRYPAGGDPFFVGLRVGDAELGLVSEAGARPGPDGQRCLLSVAVDDVDALLDTVRRLGGTVLAPPTDMPWGERVGHIQDPDGNTVNLTRTL
jgi:predicted enzyme related to lactoylglutathione lyase